LALSGRRTVAGHSISASVGRVIRFFSIADFLLHLLTAALLALNGYPNALS
jgi:hypothetical protein